MADKESKPRKQIPEPVLEGAKKEEDGDIHLVISIPDKRGKTMIVEFPHGALQRC